MSEIDINKPDTSFDFVTKWAQKAAIASKKQGRADAAKLWEDCLEHLLFLNNENRMLAAIIGKYSPAKKVTEEDKQWAMSVLDT